MSRQDKATTDRNAKTLRELVKLPENKVCADCKRNDPRWASWNLGVFVCIRCSGIHRSMGTHISKVKSVDLDVWTPEQMLSVQKWGNARANLYWEAHLKAGHVPPDHKMESFIRSKYESRRWAMEGPVPSDPSVLESAGGASGSSPLPPTPPPQTTTHNTAQSQPQAQQRAQHTLLSTQARTSGVARSQPAQPVATPTPPLIAPAPGSAPAPAPAAPKNDILELDFHAPPAPAPGTAPGGAPANKNVKADILSLFSTPATNANAGAFGTGFGANAFQQQQPQQPQQQQQFQAQSMMGSTGWGAQPQGGGWNAPAPSGGSDLWGAPAAAPVTNLWSASGAGSNPWAATAAAAQPTNNAAFASAQNPWGSSSIANTMGGSNTNDLFSAPFSSSGSSTAKKDDAFGDLWSGFK